MKKLYTIVCLLMMSLVLSAAGISQEQAMGNARSFMLQKSGDRLAKGRRVSHPSKGIYIQNGKKILRF